MLNRNRLALDPPEWWWWMPPPPAHNRIWKKPILNILSNAELVKYWISKWFIQNWESAKDLAEMFVEYNKDLWNFMMQIVEYNIASKRWSSWKAFSATWNIDWVYYKNPREYLQKIKEKVIDSTSEFTIFKTFFWITQETKAELESTLSAKSVTDKSNTYKAPDQDLLEKEVKIKNNKTDMMIKLLGSNAKDRKFKKLIKKSK
jgi:hypothetical protein